MACAGERKKWWFKLLFKTTRKGNPTPVREIPEGQLVLYRVYNKAGLLGEGLYKQLYWFNFKYNFQVI